MARVQSSRKFPIITVFIGLCAMTLAVAPVAAAVCGNATVETGEDCDDGTQNGTANSCCTALCTFSGKSPNVIVGDLTGVTAYGTTTPANGIHAYAIGTTSCNLGSCWLNWFSAIPEHPVIGQNMYRLKDGRFEQLGQSWLKHGFTALAGSVCSASCNAPPNGSHLGINCSDPYSSGLNGSQNNLGPKQDVNPNTGVYPYPDSRITTTGNAIFKRLQVHDTDLDPTLNPGALYFVEGQYVTHDDAAAKRQDDNASYRSLTVGVAPNFNLTLTGSTQRQKAGIQAWKATDPTVTETIVGAPEGIYILSSKATSLGGGIYHYEYAVENLTDQRAGQSFTVPLPVGTTVTNVGFHDVDYHSGEPFDPTDWTPTVTAGSVTWATTPYATNQLANALRWGTLYNFRFDANQAPGSSPVVIGLFRPGTPTTVSVTTVTPGICSTAPNGTACSDNSACTSGDACQSGACVPGTPVICSASDACHDVGTCAPATGACSNPAKPNGTACNDGSLCTSSDACQSGACVGASPVVCTASDACHQAGTCAPATGACSNPAAPNGTTCSDGNACTQADSCQGGSCLSGSPVVCAASDACHQAGTCAPATGTCSDPTATDGTTCSDGNACSQADACQAGTCIAGTPVVCSPSDSCHDAGTCDSLTGSCSNPARVDGSACDDGNGCTTNDACSTGICAGVGIQAPAEIDNGVQVSLDSGVATISWNTAFGATWSAVLRGSVSGLPVGPGGADEVCLVNGMIGASTTDAQDPASDEGFWYLVQGTNSCARGSLGFQAQNGVLTVERLSATCP